MLVFQLDLFCDSHTIFRDVRRAIRFVDDDIAPFWTQRDFDSVCECAHAFQDFLTGIFFKFNVFCCHVESLLALFKLLFDNGDNIVSAQDHKS